MPRYEPNQQIIAQSLEELKFILDWTRLRENDYNTTVLVGGWAVDAYNPWYGSIDIDLVTNSRTKNSLMHILLTERGFKHYRIEVHTVYKHTDYGPILIDFGNRDERYLFEGKDDELNFDLLNGNTIIRKIRGGNYAPVPTRSLLLLFKLKASWDRAYRIEFGKSDDPEWEHGKLIKDYADIIALLDPRYGGTEVDLNFLGEKLNEFDFLMDCLRIIPENNDAVEKYNRMDKKSVKEIIDRLLRLAL